MRFIEGPGAPSDHRKCREKTRKKGNPDYPACVHQQRRPGASLELRFSIRMPRMIPTAFQSLSLSETYALKYW